MAEQGKRSACITIGSKNVGGLTGEGVIVGIIDSGIEYTHREFRDRIIYVWDIPNERVYTKDDIDSGNTEQGDTNGHGTAVAGIACGERGVAYKSSIIAVVIRRNSQEDIMRGIEFIAEKGKELDMPAVINISYGTNSGSHNGQSEFERFVDRISGEYKVVIVVSCGNEGDRSHHYRGQGNNDVEFNIGNSLSSIHMELWKNFVDEYTYEIVAPDGDTGGTLDENNKYFDFILNKTQVTVTINDPMPNRVDQSIYIDLKGMQFVDAGIWKIRVRAVNTVQDGYSIWMPVGEGVDENTKFLAPEIKTTLTIPSTAYRALSVGAYDPVTGVIAPFSGRGYTREVEYVKPDIVAPGVNITTAGLGGGYTTFTGTSAAAPFVSGAAALLMEWGIVQGNDPNMYGERLKAYLRRYAARDRSISYPNSNFGYGKLCFKNVYDNLIPISAMKVNTQESEQVSIIIEKNEVNILVLENMGAKFCPLEYGDYVIVYIDRSEYERMLTSSSMGRGARAYTPLLMGIMDELTDAADITLVQEPPLELSGSKVLIAIIDTGIDYNDEAFKYENGDSRIYSIWVQDEEYTDENNSVCFGREYTNAEITAGNINVTDEEGHGTALAKTVLQAAPDSELVIVKLKGASNYYRERMGISEETVAFESSDVMLGVDYAVDKAREARRPISILIALGTNEGGHDGQTFLEKYLLDISAKTGVCITAAAGNEALTQRHTSFEIGEKGYYDVEISIGENVEVASMWMWNNIADRVDVGIIPPVGESIGRIEARNNFVGTYSLPLIGADVTVEYRIPFYQTTSQLTILNIRRPIAGVWKIRVYGTSIYSVIDCWLPISNLVPNTVFLSPNTSSTVTVPGTLYEIITIGAYDYNARAMVPTSGRGPTRFNVLKPELAAPSTGATSISAAVTVGAAALLLQWGIIRGNEFNMNTATIKSMLIRGAEPVDVSEIYPNNLWGFGVLNLYNTFSNI